MAVEMHEEVVEGIKLEGVGKRMQNLEHWGEAALCKLLE